MPGFLPPIGGNGYGPGGVYHGIRPAYHDPKRCPIRAPGSGRGLRCPGGGYLYLAVVCDDPLGDAGGISCVICPLRPGGGAAAILK